MVRTLIATLSLAALLLAATLGAAQQPPAAAPAPAIKTIATTLDIMKAMTIPLSDAVFNAGADAPKDAAAWDDVRLKAAALAEAGNLLMLGTRVRDQGEWMTLARAQVDAAEAVVRAAGAKNGDQLSTTADALYETCAGCHKVYMDKK